MRCLLNKLWLSFIFLGIILPSYATINSASAQVAHKKHRSVKARHRHKAGSHKHKRNYMEGPASFYSSKFEGRKMANGRRYNSKAYTAAHSWLPLGTKLKVTNLDKGPNNGRVLYVEVTDRMSSHTPNIIDLTPAAAKYLNHTGRGLHVRLQVISNAEFELHRAKR